jgi:hypothetical protein
LPVSPSHSRIVPWYVPETPAVPSGANAQQVINAPSGSVVASGSAVAPSQMRTVPSHEADATRRPFGE